MPIVKIYGGLGNQLFQYSFAHVVSKKFNEKITLDVSFYKKRDWPDFQLDKLKIGNDYDTICYSENNKIQRGFSKILRKIKYSDYSFFKEDDPFYSYYPDIMKAKTFYDGYFANVKYFNEYRNELKNLYNANYKFNETAKNFLDRINSTESVAIHFRRGDYVKIGCSIDSSYYSKALKYIEENWGELNKFTLYVFSDDLDYAVSKLKEICGNKINFVPVSVLEDKNKDLTEFCLMKSCKYFIAANSTYSWWAAYLADRDDYIIVPKVKQWNEKTYPERWKLINAEIQ